MTTMFEGVSVSANKKLNKWINEKVKLSVETRIGGSLQGEDLENYLIKYWTETVQLNLVKVSEAKGDYYKMHEVLSMASNKDNKLTRILVDDLYFKNGSSFLSLTNKAYREKTHQFLIDYFGQSFIDKIEKENEEAKIAYKKERERIEAQQSAENYKNDLVFAYNNCKPYINFMKQNEGYRVIKNVNGKFHKFQCVNEIAERYIKEKRKEPMYKWFYDIMKFAYNDHDGDIMKAIEWIEEKF